MTPSRRFATAALEKTLLRLSRPARLGIFAGSVWAPVAYLMPIAFSIGRVGPVIDAWEVVWEGLLAPVAVLWAAAAVLHLSLWAMSKRSVAAAALLGLLSVVPSAIVIGTLSFIGGTDCPSQRGGGIIPSLGGCVSHPDRFRNALVLAVLLVALSLLVWILTGAAEVIRRLRTR